MVFFLLRAPFPLGISSQWGLEAGGIEGGGLSAACERFVLWCNQHSLILFDFFFSPPFCCCYFSCFHRVGSFLPSLPLLWPPFPL